MRKTRIYLDTSVISFLFADDVPELKGITREFFELYVRTGLYDVFISEVVVAEIERTAGPALRHQLRAVAETYALPALTSSDEVGPLVTEYIGAGVIPPTHVDDARHVAIATCNEMDILLSWNFKHLANIKKQIGVRAVNERNGYFHPLLLTTPMEVTYEDG